MSPESECWETAETGPSLHSDNASKQGRSRVGRTFAVNSGTFYILDFQMILNVYI